MLPMVIGLLSVVVYGLIALFLAFTDYLDWHGRVEVLHEKHPKLAKFVKNRLLRLVLLLMIFAMLATDVKENLKQIETEPFVIRVVAAPTADPGAVNPETAKWKALYESVSGPPESPTSLRRRTMKLANEVSDFLRGRYEAHPPFAYPNSNDPNPSEERKAAIKKAEKYDQETTDEYMRKYKDRAVGIISEYRAKGVSVGFLGQSFSQRVPVWAIPGSMWEDNPQNELVQFRELAFHVDGKDELISPNF
jgi:hypothetical protein